MHGLKRQNEPCTLLGLGSSFDFAFLLQDSSEEASSQTM